MPDRSNTPETPASPAARWIGAGFLGGAATVGLIWVMFTRPAAPPNQHAPTPAPLTLAPAESTRTTPTPTPDPIPAPESPLPVQSASDQPASALTAAPLPAPQSIAEPTAPPVPPPAAPTTPPHADPLTTRLRINEATAAELDLLPGIGPALADRIIAHRRAGNTFHSPEDLEGVPGIGPRIAQGIAPYIRFD